MCVGSDRDHWWAVVFKMCKKWVIFLPAWKIFTSHKKTLLHGVNLLGFDKGKRRQYAIRYLPQLKPTFIS
jgi:hypothetical protein